MMARRPIWLASSSPRRKRLLEEAGITPRVEPSDLDDAQMKRGSGTSPEAWVMTLAFFKGRRVADRLHERNDAQSVGGTVLAADTLCVHDNELLGQPRDEVHAREMLRAMRNSTHRTMTGVCLIDLATNERTLFVDIASVRMGEITDAMIDEYVASGEWRGKAGAYNLIERQDAGWPIACEGDPATVMGLPMQRLKPMLVKAEGAAQ